jgi:acyl-CoA thioester hydrolase
MPARIEPGRIDVTSLPLTYETIIPQEYLDVMGHMNVMWYTHVFDQGVVGTFDMIGLDERFMKEHDGGAFALESHIHYLSEVRVQQQVGVRTRILGRSEKRFHILQFMVNLSKNDVAATFEVVGTYVDMKTRRTAPLPGIIAAKLDKMIEQHRKLDWEPPVCGIMRP